MNPALIELATSAVMSKGNQSRTGMTDSDYKFAVLESERKQRRRKYTLIAVSSVIALLIARKIYKDVIRSKGLNDQDLDAQLAREIMNAINPSGMPMWIPDGTNEEALYSIASKIKEAGIEFSKVAKKYKNITGRELMPDLQSELDTDELTKFNSMLNDDNSTVTDENVHDPDAVYIYTIEDGEFYKNPDDFFGIDFKAERVITNAKLTGVIKEYDTFGVTRGKLYELMNTLGDKFYIKEHKFRAMKVDEYRKMANSNFVQKSEIRKK